MARVTDVGSDDCYNVMKAFLVTVVKVTVHLMIRVMKTKSLHLFA